MNGSQQNPSGSGQTPPTVYINGSPAANAKVELTEAAYLLSRYEYHRLKSGANPIDKIIEALAYASLGFLVNTVAKWLAHALDEWEAWAFVVTAIFALILKIISLCLNDDRKRLLKAMDNHFKKGARSI